MKQKIDIKKSEVQINKLKRKLEKGEHLHHFETYKILNAIFIIRNKYYKNYPINRLAHESVIKDLFTSHRVRLIMSSRHLTKQSMKLIDKNVFSAIEICRILNGSRKLHIAKVQNDFFRVMAQKKKEGVLKSPQLRQSLVLFNSGKKITKININIAVAKQLIYDIRSIKKRLSSKIDLLDNDTKKTLRFEINALHKLTVGRTKLFGLF